MPDQTVSIAPPPEPSPLMRAFDALYLGTDAAFWRLPSRARSKEALRRFCILSRSFRPRAEPVDIAAHPRVHWPEYGTLAVFAGATDADVDVFLDDFHAEHQHHPYPAALLDPLGRIERWP
jgi:hypothetical protein